MAIFLRAVIVLLIYVTTTETHMISGSICASYVHDLFELIKKVPLKH